MRRDELLLDEFTLVSAAELTASSGLSRDEIQELVELGVLAPRRGASADWEFPARCIELARLARRLQLEFDLPLSGVALVLSYRERVRDLQERLRRLECEVPRFRG